MINTLFGNRTALLGSSAFLVLVIVGFNYGCKPDAGSKVSSLDNYVANAGQFKLNDCTAAHSLASENKPQTIESWMKSNVVGSNDQSTLEIVRTVLLRVPNFALNAFINLSGNKIYLSEGSAAQCQKLKQREGGFACWFAEDASRGVAIGSGTLPNGQTINLQQAIKHALLRSIVSSVASIQLNGNILAKAGAKDEQLRTVGAYFTKFGEALIADLQSNGLGRTELEEAAAGALAKEALIEAYDSFHCSSRTQNIFKTCFPNSFEVFKAEAKSEASVRAITFDKTVDAEACKRARG